MHTQISYDFPTPITSVYQLPQNLFDLDDDLPASEVESSAEKIEQTVIAFQKNLVHHTGYLTAMEKIGRCHRLGRHGLSEPSCLLITAESGCGKSTIREQYAKTYERYEADDRTVIPVLHLQLPSAPTIKNVAEKILIELGDPFAEKGSAEGKTARIVKLLKECGVELVILDEFQHFVDRSSEKVEYKVADWLKSLISESKVPFILMGLPRCQRILDVNEQLRRRFLPRVALHRFQADTPTQRKQFFTLLKGLEKCLPLEGRTALTDRAVTMRIYYATYGVIDHTMKLVSSALEIVLTEQLPTIDQDVLRRAFQEAIWKGAHDQDNPFHEAFKERALTGVGEPFCDYV